MAKREAAVKKSSRQAPIHDGADVLPFEHAKKHRGRNLTALPNDRKRVECLTEAQSHYYISMKSKTVTFATGCAGTGKTAVATGLACEMLLDRQIDQIVLTRPIVGVGEDMGFLPGEVEDKFDPFFAPVRAIMQQYLGYAHVDALIRSERIIVSPLQFIRGTTYDRAFMILDEAQNTTVRQMQAFLTRIGKYSTVSVNGDIEQTDIKGTSGLADAMHRFKDHPAFGFIEFEVDDIVRSGITKDVILAYRKR